MKIIDTIKDHKTTAMVSLAAIAGAATIGLTAPTQTQASLTPDNLNVGVGASSQDGDESSALGLRVLSQDGLENLGIGADAMNKDGDEMSHLSTRAEATDDLEHLMTDTKAVTQDGDESSELHAHSETHDDLDKSSVVVGGTQRDGNKMNNFGIGFSFED